MQSTDTQSDQIKGELLRDGGYHFNFEMDSYVHRKTRKVFSLEFVEDHDDAELKRCIQSPAPDSGWTFFFNEPPSLTMRRLLEQTNNERYSIGAGVRT